MSILNQPQGDDRAIQEKVDAARQGGRAEHTVLAQDALWPVRMHTAHHTEDAGLLRILATDAVSSVRISVAGNPYTEADVLLTLAADNDFNVCHALTRNPNIYRLPALLTILMGDAPGVVSGLARSAELPEILAELAINSGYVPSCEIAQNPAATTATLLIIARRQHPEHEFNMVMESLASRDCAPEVLAIVGQLQLSRRAALSLLRNAATPIETIRFIANSTRWNTGDSDIGHLAQIRLAPDVSSERLIERRFEHGPEGVVTHTEDGGYSVTTDVHLASPVVPEITITDVPGDADDGASRRVKFQFENGLEDFLIAHWAEIDCFAGYDFVGQQYVAGSGIIDLLALSKDKTVWLVIELKRSRANDVVVGQILRYMGWVDRVLATPDQRVTGLIIGHSDDQRLRDALAFTREGFVSYKSYRLTIDFV
ncbi:endonuclease NucS domain-containing protein [Cryobacterium sp. TMT2-23]|uniref:endonuclease NucS domain-containing protein n=1 Tax=Cryobacterium sp. TMT2-23 TaxID=1259252 RepID=UPI00106CE6D3|nr:endonuclease NucS domain-containing protein [Cryobacterium sp. TMT2-23]TFD23812.1 DUF91 domain-containing protein [Cryobacterium sp. TMT2-23]